MAARLGSGTAPCTSRVSMTADVKTGGDAQAAPKEAQALKFSGYQKFIVALLAFLQFSIILDFMIISPLGAIIMPDLNISPQRFGEIVSAYAFSAGAVVPARFDPEHAIVIAPSFPPFSSRSSSDRWPCWGKHAGNAVRNRALASFG